MTRCGAIVSGLLIGIFASACTTGRMELDAQTRATLARAAPPPGNNWPLAPAEIEALFADPRLELGQLQHTEKGIMGAYRARVRATARELVVKWKEAPAGDADGWNNSPRKELAAYAIQKWFLDPVDFVVPTTALHCFSLDHYRRLVPDAEATIEGTRCVLGALSVWMDDVLIPEALYEPQRFLRDASYAYHMANLNLLTHLIDHGDGGTSNFVAALDPTNRRVFAVDNGVAFGELLHNILATDWSAIHVPALRRAAVQRLRELPPAPISALAVVAEFRAGADGVLQPVTPGPVADPSRGARVRAGWVQLGLTDDEIARVRDRVRDLLRRVDRRELALF